jgi:endo-1,4-beta-xylanase
MAYDRAMTQSSSLSRRDALAGLSAGLMAAAIPATAQSGRVLFGAAAMKENFTDDPRYRDALVKHCDIIVPMNDLKWEALRPTREQFSFEDADRLIGFARSNGKLVRGHTLCWYGGMPVWAKGMSTRREAETELRRHIETVVAHYRGLIPSWDVVNEAIAHDPPKQGVWRDTIWHKLLGPEHIDIAFATAAAADPRAELVYNDYDLENTGERQTQRRQHVLALVRRLQDKKIPIHAIGLQAHLYAEQAIDVDGLGRFVRDLKALGLRVLVTEMDVIDWRLPGPPAERDEAAAQHVRTFLAALAGAGGLTQIITWGITDRYSWIPEHFKRKDGLPNRPLPLDTEYRPKPMMRVIEEFLKPI